LSRTQGRKGTAQLLWKRVVCLGQCQSDGSGVLKEYVSSQTAERKCT